MQQMNLTESSLVKFDQLKARIDEMLVPINGMQVRDKAENAIASGALSTLKCFIKEIDALRVATIAPSREFVESVNKRAKELTAPLSEAEANVKRVMAAFAAVETARINAERQAAEEKARKERERLAEEERARRKAEEEEKKAAAAFGVDPDSEAAQHRQMEAEKAKRERDRLAAASRSTAKRLEAERPKNVRKVKKFEITDWQDVPRKYWKIDETILGADVRAGVADIPGVRIWEEDVVVAR